MKKSIKPCETSEEMVLVSVYVPLSTKMRLQNKAKEKSKEGCRVTMTSLASFYVHQGVNTPERITTK